MNHVIEEEGFQGLSSIQISNLKNCVSGSSNCTSLKYYDSNGKLQNSAVKNSSIPVNMYLDSDNILQPVPYGNIVNSDYKGYQVDPSYNIGNQSANAHIGDNVIKNQTVCDPTNTQLYYPNTSSVCADVSYISMSGNNLILTNGKIVVPDGYYINAGLVTLVPYGYTASDDKRSIIIKVDYDAKVSGTSYDTNNYNITYHSDPSNGSPDIGSAGAGKMWVLDNSGNLITVPYSEMSGNTLYNEPGSFRFGSSNYVPNYEESVYLSKLTNISTVAPVVNSTANAAGFCSSLCPDKNAIEQKCNALDPNACASTTCCALLGGQKCVYGSENGPYFKSNYSNFQVKNPEFYYYQGKCYGNCQSQGNQGTTLHDF